MARKRNNRLKAACAKDLHIAELSRDGAQRSANFTHNIRNLFANFASPAAAPDSSADTATAHHFYQLSHAQARETLAAFLPFQYEHIGHILELQRQDGPATPAEVAYIMGSAFHPQHSPAPAPGVLTPGPTIIPQAGAAGPHVRGFVGIPSAKVIVGSIGYEPRPGPTPCICMVSANFPGTVHYPFECPLRHIQRYGQCAGWLVTGRRIPGAWVGNDLTPATCAEWTRNIIDFDLAAARASGPDRVLF